jgi:hypothetical protein
VVRSARLWRAVLRRTRSDWPVVLAAWLLLVCATTLLATGALYADTVAAGGVRRVILDAPPEQRLILVRTTVARPGDAATIDAGVRSAIAGSIERTGGEIASVVRSGSFADASVAPDDVDRLTLLAAYEGIERHAELVTGAWPVAGATPMQSALSAPAAEAMGVAVGERLSLASRLDADLVVDLEVVAVFQPTPGDPYWASDPLELAGVVPGDPYTNAGPVVVARDDLLGPRVGGRLEAQWRGIPDIGRLHVDDVGGLELGVEQLPERLRAAVTGRQMAVEAPLPSVLAEAGRSVVVGRSGVTLLTIQFAILAGYAVVLVGGLLLERRRAETALLRSRGATSLHLLLMALAEALVLAAVAVAPAPFLALGIVRVLAENGPLGQAGITATAEVTPATVAVAALAGLAGVLALALPTLGSSVSLAGVRAAIGRQAGRTLPQRLGIDLALVAVAVVAIWQLRLYGAPLTRNARGVLGVDPLLVAAPAIGLLGGAVLALRIVPRVAELGERLLVRRRGLVAPLGGRQLARRPLRYTRAALLLMLAAGLGTFATAHAATWTRSQGDQAAYQAAADVRIVPAANAGPAALVAGSAYRAVEGVEAAMAVTSQSIDLGRNVRGGPLLALDPAVAGDLLTFPTAASAAATRSALDALAAARPEPPLQAIAGEPARLSLVVDASIRSEDFGEENVEPLDPGAPVVLPSLVVADADGRVHRLPGSAGAAVGEGQRLVFAVTDPDDPGARPAWPLSLVAVEVVVSRAAGLVLVGSVDLVELAASDAPSGDAWTALPIQPATSGWRWTHSGLDGTQAYEPPDDAPARIVFGEDAPGAPPPVFPQGPATFRQIALQDEPARLPVVASHRFLELTGARVGEDLASTTFGQRLPIRIVAAVREFPRLDPGEPFVVTDAAGLELNRYAITGQAAEPDEWWFGAADGRSTEVAATLAAPPFESESVVDREALLRALSGDPVSLGIIGALGLGAVAAMVFAGIGFLVSATVSVSERVGEFALLRALGLSGRQLAVWLSLESAFLLFVGLLAGSALGVLLAWLVLPFATLTQTGAPPVPQPTVVVPWQAVVPAWILAVVLLVVTIVIVRRQLPAVRISGVLRARDE